MADHAQPGDLVHDRGCEPDAGWFIVGHSDYWDVDNACWAEAQPGDAPWTDQFFQIFGPVPALVTTPLEDRRG